MKRIAMILIGVLISVQPAVGSENDAIAISRNMRQRHMPQSGVEIVVASLVGGGFRALSVANGSQRYNVSIRQAGV